MKKYAIIMDENETVRVVPSRWLTEDKTAIFWPPLKKNSEITNAIINLKSVTKDWKKYPITKYIKSSEEYTDAVEESKIQNLSMITDASDDDKLKDSRSQRNKKSYDGFETALQPPKKKTKVNDSPSLSSASKQAVLSTLDNKDCDFEKNDSESDGFEEVPGEAANNENNMNTSNTKVIHQKAPASLNVIKTPVIATGTNTSNTGTSNGNGTVGKNHLPDDSANHKAEPKSGENSELDVQNLSERELLIATYGIAVKVLQKVNYNSKKINKLKTSIERIQRKNLSTDNKALSIEEMTELSKYFPIDIDDEDIMTKMESVEKKLANEQFFNNAVASEDWQQKLAVIETMEQKEQISQCISGTVVSLYL